MSLNKPLEEISESDLQTLKVDRVAEIARIEYKRMLTLKAEEAKAEFRRDVTSFANAAGGDVLIGVTAPDGVPVDIVGIDEDQDKFRLRLEEVLQSHIRPRIPGVKTHAVRLTNEKHVVIVRIPKSFSAPHEVQVGNSNYEFWARNSAGKYRLTVDQLRSAFVGSESLAERVRAFRLDRLAAIVGDIPPVPLRPGPRLVIHLASPASFSPGAGCDLSPLRQDAIITKLAKPLYTRGSELAPDYRYNFDGFVTFRLPRNGRLSDSYLQVFRNGAIELVEAYLISTRPECGITFTACEKALLDELPRLMQLQRTLRFYPPFAVMLTLTGAQGQRLHHITGLSEPTGDAIDRDTLAAPDVMIDDTTSDLAAALRPVFDTIWNAAGEPGSPNYDSSGHWRAHDQGAVA